MPRKPKIDHARLANEVLTALRRGPTSGRELCQALGISQPVLSRLLREQGSSVLILGAGPRTRYALKREVPDVGSEIALYEIQENGKSRLWGRLFPIFPNGFHWKTDHQETTFEDLPYFLEDSRPSGFLGRLVPRQHPELELPLRLEQWTSGQLLRYLTRFGWNLIGNLVIGEQAFRLYLAEHAQAGIPSARRKTAYARMAERLLELGDAGSSAGGEQPKFLAYRGPKATPVLVKFSPPMETEIGRRRADLLVCEHIALKVMQKHGIPAARSQLVVGAERMFFEIERFDRVSPHGRKGVISLRALDLEFAGLGSGWTAVSTELSRQSLISQGAAAQVAWLDTFGDLIGNTDRHLGNISFFRAGEELLGLTPAYDMLPMLYAPQNEQIVERKFKPRAPSPSEAGSWRSAWVAALDFWKEAASHSEISPAFRKIAEQNRELLQGMRPLLDLLPEA